VRLSWPEVGTFTICGSRVVDIQPAPGAAPETVRLFLRGPVAAALLRVRGYLVLHGSAVALNGGATCFLGASGWGKSTLAAALEDRGHLPITDDVATIDMARSPRVLPGPSQLKLWPDVLCFLGEDATALHRVHPQLEKRVRPIDHRPPAKPLLLRRVYVLATAPALTIDRLAPREALVELLRHSYGPRTLQRVRREEHFRQCARVASEISVARLRVPRDFARLAEVASLIEQDSADAS